MEATIIDWPSAGWQNAFRQQSTPETMEAAIRCATIELERLYRLGVPIAYDPGDLVQRVIEKTLDGTRIWRPNTVSLRHHLRDGIRDLGRRERAHLDRVASSVEIDHVDDEDPVWGDSALAGADLARGSLLRDLAQRFERELWALADGDQPMLAVLRVMTDGTHAPLDIVAETGLPLLVVENARRRLRRLAGCVRPELLRDIRAELDLEASTDAV